MRICAAWLISALVSSCADAFLMPNRHAIISAAERFSTTKLLSTSTGVVSLDRNAQREIDQLQQWAGQCGVQAENGFCLVPDSVDGNEDWRVATSSGGVQGSRVLYVPGEMILSAPRIAQEFQGYVDPSLAMLRRSGMLHLAPQFHLFLKVLLEYENGVESPYYPWIASMPRKWNTAVSMDDFCLSCLPPYIKSVCERERDQFVAFRAALQVFDYLSPESKGNDELLKFAYNVVFTRSFPTEGGLQIIPIADMFNHGYPANVALTTNQEDGACEAYLIEDVAPGGDLHLSYGQPTNPSRFLATYGFLNEAPATYCKILFSNPSQELQDIGYDPSRMLFYTENGAISQEVWDVLLYSRLERKPELSHVKEAFYQAHMTGDEATKSAIHQEFLKETATALLRHVDHILSEVFDLTFKMNSYDASAHPRLPLLRKHHEMVTSTFQKVRDNLAQMVAE